MVASFQAFSETGDKETRVRLVSVSAQILTQAIKPRVAFLRTDNEHPFSSPGEMASCWRGSSWMYLGTASWMLTAGR